MSPQKKIYKVAILIFSIIGAGGVIYLINYARVFFMEQRLNQEIAALYREEISFPDGREVSEPAAPAASENGLPEKEPGADMVSEPEDSPELPSEAAAPSPAPSEREKLLAAETAGRRRFQSLLDINGEFRGMLIIDGLDMALPFVQTTDNEKYLYTNFEGEASRYGTVFLSCYNDSLLTDHNTVLFGHHTDAGHMFTPLVRYRKLETVFEAPVIELDSLTGYSRWLVFAAYICEPDYGYIETNLDGPQFEELLGEIKERSLFTTNVDVNTNDRILTLSTCTYEFQNARFVVHARQLREGETAPPVSAETNPNPKEYAIPNQYKLADIAMENVAVMRSPRTLKNYYYLRTGYGLELYIGNTTLVQGGYACFTGNIPEGAAFSPAYLANDRVFIAIEKINGQKGIFLLTSDTADGPFAFANGGYPLTPDEARSPVLAVNGEELWMAYVSGEGERERLYRAPVYGDGTSGEPVCVYEAPESTGVVPVGMAWRNGKCLLVFQEKINGLLKAVWAEESAAPAEGKAEAGFPAPFVLPAEDNTGRMRFYGEVMADGSVRTMMEKDGRLTPGTLLLPVYG
ncbi:MAG: class B sortase [Clostridiales bacterium]|nr:class B sortase [Clostridiales bacterium]